MGLYLKVGATLGATGIVGGGVVAAYSFLAREDKSVRNELKKIGYSILEDRDNSEWEKVFNAYKTKPSDSKRFTKNILNKEELIRECNSSLNNNFDNQKDYSLIKKWCVKEETIQAMLTRNGYEAIGTVASNNNNTAKWQQKVNAWKADKTSTNKISVDFKGTNDVSLLETACAGLNISILKTHSDNDFEKKFIQARDWCALKKDSAS